MTLSWAKSRYLWANRFGDAGKPVVNRAATNVDAVSREDVLEPRNWALPRMPRMKHPIARCEVSR